MNPPKANSIVEYKLRVPKNLAKNYYVMKLNSPRPVNFSEVNNAYLSRKNPIENEEERSDSPSTGAGSQFGKEKKEETKKKRRGQPKKEISSEDMLYSLQLCGKKDKRFHGKKEGTILENSSYYILTQCPDGVFEAVPIQAWYNFKPSIDYHVLSSDDVEKEFSKRDKTINYHNMMVKKRLQAMEEKDEEHIVGEKVKQAFRNDFMIHDDEDIEQEMSDEDSENEKKTKSTKIQTKKKDKYRGKKKNNENDDENDADTDEEEEFDNVESKEFDYMSESSSTDEEKELQDEPEPEKKGKAKDDLNALLSESDSEEVEEELTSVGKELKEILKREAGDDGSSLDEDEDEDDIDDNEKYSKSALFMPGNDGKKKKSARSGSISGSSSSSRSATPTLLADSTRPSTPQSGKKSNKDAQQRRQTSNRSTPTPTSTSTKQDYQASRKRPSSRQSLESNSPPSKKEKLLNISEDKRLSKKQSGESGISQKTSQKEGDGKEPLTITEVTIRRYLSHKPMTTTDLVKKFKTKRTGLTKEQTVSTIAAILKKIGPERQTIEGKLYLSIKPKK